jgi:hypothetical protein
MKHANILTAPIALLSGSLLLASCSGWSYQPPMRGNAQVEPMNFASVQAAPTAPASFTQSLASEYLGHAVGMRRFEDDGVDLAVAPRLVLLGRPSSSARSKSKIVQP